jgi:hypothetical protein
MAITAWGISRRMFGISTPIPTRPHPIFSSLAFTHKRPVLRIHPILGAPVMPDTGIGVEPHHGIAGAMPLRELFGLELGNSAGVDGRGSESREGQPQHQGEYQNHYDLRHGGHPCPNRLAPAYSRFQQPGCSIAQVSRQKIRPGRGCAGNPPASSSPRSCHHRPNRPAPNGRTRRSSATR